MKDHILITKKEIALSAIAQGYSQNQAARTAGLAKSTVSRLVKQTSFMPTYERWQKKVFLNALIEIGESLACYIAKIDPGTGARWKREKESEAAK